MPDRQVESDLGTAAAAKHIRWFGTQDGEQAVSIIAVRLNALLFFWVVERTACVPPTVVADDGVVVGEMGCDAVEAGSISSTRNYQAEPRASSVRIEGETSALS